jgi:Domain of unknown function (DUF4118)
MPGRWTRPGIARWLSGLPASVLMVAAASGLDALLERWSQPVRVLYILAVLPAAVVWGTGLAVFTAVLSALAFHYLFVTPVHSLEVPSAAKYARASAVTVQAEIGGDVLRITVRDDGAGGADFARGTGLTGLKDRVEAIGGRIFLDSPCGAGTSLRAELPLALAADGVTVR